MKSKNNRLISFLLALVMIVSYLPLHGIEAKADSVQKSSGGTDVLDALGINSNEAPKECTICCLYYGAVYRRFCI